MLPLASSPKYLLFSFPYASSRNCIASPNLACPTNCGLSSKNAALPKIWSGCTCVLMTYKIGLSVIFLMARRNSLPTFKLPPVSMTATPRLPTTKLILQISP